MNNESGILVASGSFAIITHDNLVEKFTGKTTQEHIHLQLIDKAKSLLWGTNDPISQIAYELGFEHPSHFTKIFKTKTGKSPSEYRLLN